MRGEEVGRAKKSKILKWSDFGRRCEGGCRRVRGNKSGCEIRPGRSPLGRFRVLCCKEGGGNTSTAIFGEREAVLDQFVAQVRAARGEGHERCRYLVASSYL